MRPHDHFLRAKQADEQQSAVVPLAAGAAAGAAAGYGASRLASSAPVQPVAKATAGVATKAPGAAAAAGDLVKQVAKHAIPIALSLLARRKMPGSPGMGRPSAPGAPTVMHAGPVATGPSTGFKEAALHVHEAILAGFAKEAAGTLDPDHPEAMPFMIAVVAAMKLATEEIFYETPLYEKAAAMEIMPTLLDACDFLELGYGLVAKRANRAAMATMGQNMTQTALQSYGRGYDEQGGEIVEPNSARAVVGTALGMTAGYGLGIAADRALGRPLGVASMALPTMGMLAGGFAGHELAK